MAVITFTFDTGAVDPQSIVAAVCVAHGYDALIQGQPNPETPAQFARRKVKEFIISAVRARDRQAVLDTVKDIDLS